MADRSEGRVADSNKIDLSTQISQKVIDAALDAVAAKTGAPAAPLAEEKTEGQAVEVAVEVEAAAKSEPPATDLEEAHKALGDKEAQLELSQKLARDTMGRLKETHERMLRAAADLDNYRKRAAREKDEVVRFGNEALLRDLLPVMDNLDRAVEHANKTHQFEHLLKGVEMTRKAFEDTLAKKGVKVYSATGQPFDPNLHEALQQVETAEATPGTVVQEIARGFLLHDRLLRPAAVVVAKAPAVEPAPAQAKTPEEQTPAESPAPDAAPAKEGPNRG